MICGHLSFLHAYIKGHYSIKKGAALLGIGMNNVIPVKTDSAGRMIPAELELMINTSKSEVGDTVPMSVST